MGASFAKIWLFAIVVACGSALFATKSITGQGIANTKKNDISAYFPDDAEFYAQIKLKDCLQNPTIKNLLKQRGIAEFALDVLGTKGRVEYTKELNLAEYLISATTRVTTAGKVFGSEVIIFEGKYDNDKLLKTVKEAAKSRKMRLTTETVGDHELVRAGETVYVLLNDSVLVAANSPAVGEPQAFLRPAPGSAEKVLNELIARAVGKSNGNLNVRFASSYKNLPANGQLGSFFAVREESMPEVVSGSVDIEDNKLVINMLLHYGSLENAKSGELDTLKEVRKIVQDLKDNPFARYLRGFDVDRNGLIVSVQGAIPAEVVEVGLKEVIKSSAVR